jgi:YrbI family 3-deoxy-D-manno-octulosonate 8-phosphate phosphatase
MLSAMKDAQVHRQKARDIRLLLTDCDGVLTDGGVYYSARGEEMKRFSMRDGMGVERLRRLANVEVGIVTGEESGAVQRRAEKLQITELHLGAKDKLDTLQKILERRGLSLQQVAYIGDDTNDLQVMRQVGLSACPADAQHAAHQVADYVCGHKGGQGAFREFAEAIIAAQDAQFLFRGGEAFMPQRSMVQIGKRCIGEGQPVYVIAEIGINHNGSLETAKRMIDGAIFAGSDAVKFQKRTPELCVPQDQWSLERDTPWGRMTYIEYRHRVEFNAEQFAEIDRYCAERGIDWFASCWDEPSVDLIETFDPPLYKAASASLTDHALLKKMKATGKPLMISTGMSNMHQIESAVDILGTNGLLLAHSTSTYPCRVEELNLRMILTLKNRYPSVPIGYSGHEVGLAPTWAAVALGASFVERHITLDRAMWGSDHSASVEIMGLHRLVRSTRDIEQALGDGVKRVYASELGAMQKLRRVNVDEEPILEVGSLVAPWSVPAQGSMHPGYGPLAAQTRGNDGGETQRQ